MSLIPPCPAAEFPTSETKEPHNVISWAPPTPNWNPWTACNIDEGYFASTSLDRISEDFQAAFQEMQKVDAHYQEMKAYREALPVFNSRDELMGLINANPVVLVRGSTGCGKTTQVCD